MQAAYKLSIDEIHQCDFKLFTTRIGLKDEMRPISRTSTYSTVMYFYLIDTKEAKPINFYFRQNLEDTKNYESQRAVQIFLYFFKDSK